LPAGININKENIQLVRLVYDNGDWFIHLVYNSPLPVLKGAGEAMAIDLGIVDIAATACTDGKIALWPGGELLCS